MRTLSLISSALAVLLAGCGQTTTTDSSADVAARAGSTAAGGAQSGAGGGTVSEAGEGGAAGSIAVATLCPSAGWSSASQAVAVGLSGADVVVVSADGSQRVVATLGQSAGVPASDLHTGIVRTADGAVISTWWTPPEAAHTDGETVLLDRAGKVIWQLPGMAQSTWRGAPLASPAGMVAASLGSSKLVQADGTVSDLPGGDPDSTYFFGELQPDGWFAAMWTYTLELGPDGADWHYGFMNLDGRTPRELATKPAMTQGVNSYGGQAYYLTGPSSLALHLETPTEARSIELGIDAAPTSSFNAMKSLSRIVVTIDQKLAQTVDPVSGTVTAIDGAAIDAMVGTDSLGNPRWYQLLGTADSDFALGSDYEVPLFVFDTQSGAAEPVRLDLLAPLGPLDSPYCGDNLVLNDGRFGLGLRDAALAGFYVGSADGSGLERLGMPFRAVTAIRAQHVADTWVLTGVSGIDSYCTPYEPFADPAPSDAQALEGDVVQILVPGVEPLVLPEPAPAVRLDTTGLCALATWSVFDPASSETRLYDLASGTSSELDGLTGVTWL